MQAVESLYDEIKLLRDECINCGQKVWSNITISIKNSRFKVEYNYDNLVSLSLLGLNHLKNSNTKK